MTFLASDYASWITGVDILVDEEHISAVYRTLSTISFPARSDAIREDARMTAKVFFATGTARGLGKQVADAVLAAGHFLVATARNPEQIRTLRETCGSRIITASLDVTDADAAQAAVEAAIRAFGRIEVLINHAGYADLASVEDITLEDFRAQVDTNLFGVVAVTKAVLPVMRQQGSGHIIQVSCLGGRVATAGLAAYQSAKWAVGCAC